MGNTASLVERPASALTVSSATALLWAKTGPEDAWHSLGGHLVDATMTAAKLWDEWLAPRTRAWLAVPFSGDERLGRAFLAWLAGCHDLGKASPAFQIQVERLAAPLRTAGFNLPDALPNRAAAPHALVSAAIIGALIHDEFGWPVRATTGVAAILGGHHGTFPAEGFRRDPARRPDLYGWSDDQADLWMVARRELFRLVTRVSGADRLADVAPTLDRSRELALAGYVVLADWIASNETIFPYASSPFLPEYIQTSSRHANGALQAIGWSRWTPDVDHDGEWFAQRFGFSPNPVQRTAIACSTPGLMLIEAPMGVGKTEAALAVVESLAATVGLSGAFIGLPTQATSNQMFTRTMRWLQSLGPGMYVTELAHGKASQVEAYQRLHHTPSCVDCDGDAQATVAAEEWFGGAKRRLLAPFVVGTVDQVLLASAKVRHVALRQVGLLDKAIVIDEVHAYDAHMSVFLRRGLRWLGAAGVPVVLLTATLPPETRRRLIEAYVGLPVDTGTVGYPAITTALTNGAVRSTPVPLTTPPTTVQIARLDEDPVSAAGADFVATVMSLTALGANVLVVRNTVRRAQESYSALAAVLPAGSVTLLHARFTARDRLDKEQWLAGHFGPGANRPTGHVVVGTQVLEQSLDVDFDALVTDVAPVDLVLQRVGRVWRHRVARPLGLTSPLLVLAGMQRHVDRAPNFPRGSSLVYGAHLLLRSAAIFEGRSQVAIPTDIPELIASVY
ncbi:MAG: CRISPR-associated helicase Cas3', partial [Acidimicrobiales bacterium]